MAKVGFWLKGATGKLAGATMYKDANGETVAREVVKPKNPQTTKQMIQRIIMNTIMQAYSATKAITDHSFENVTAGAATMQVFMKRNLDFARQKISQMQGQGVDFYDMFNFVPLGEKKFVPNQYLVSTGSLPQVICSFQSGEDPQETLLDNLVVAAIKTNTYQGVCDALGAQRGDQITFLTFSNTSADEGRFMFCRVILDPTKADGSQASMDTPFVVENAINLPSVRNEGTADFRFVVNATQGFGIKPIDRAVYCGGVIISREINKSWLRSTCRLMYNEQSTGLSGHSMGECLDVAVSGTPVYTENEWYLNNAGQGNSAGVEAGGDAPSGGGGSTTPDTPSGGGGTTPSTGIQSVAIGANTLVAGTQGSGKIGQNIVVTFNGEGSSVSVYDQTDLENAVASEDPQNSVATIGIAAADGFTVGHIYKLYVDGSYANYSFRVAADDDED